MFKGLSPAVAAELEGVEPVDPDLIYQGEAEIDLGGRTVLLREVGPAHTRSDQIGLVDGRVLFAGDLLETRIFPIAPYFPPHDTDVDGEGWIDALDRLAQLAPHTVVPGHGEVTDASLIHDVRHYLVHVRDEALRLRKRGATADETAATVDENARTRWPSWERPEWIGLTARAFEKTLHDRYQLGTSVPAIPENMPARPTPVPGNVVASSEASGIKVTWDAVYGAIGYQVRDRLVGVTVWTEFPVSMNRFDTTWTEDGMEWEYQVRTDNGGRVKSDWSPTVRATAHPKTAPPPVGIVTTATATGVDVVWGAPTGPYTDTIDRYQVITYDKDTPGAFIDGTSVTGTSVHIDGLTPGHHYAVSVVTWNAVGGGLPGAGRAVTIGAGSPPAPGGLQVTSTDATTVQLTWSGSPQAAGYRVWVRNINNGSQSSADEFIVDTTHRDIAYLFPGTWNYEFCVTAVNGTLESAKSNCVVAPHPASG
ncbi:fibronectin type III domain-containing protein [Streptomyces virginiae]|uniref:fibronectin type III domain-containing protein n=1 Tax=Streptomyces virginiae TaxID=1961 RepID=UPI0036C497BF